MAVMDNWWETSADAWIADMGEHGDFGRRNVLENGFEQRLQRRPQMPVVEASIAHSLAVSVWFSSNEAWV